VLKKIISFGFKHDTPSAGNGVVIVDIRPLFRNPYRDKHLRYKRGTDLEVQQDVMKTPDFHAKYAHLRQQATVPGTEVVCIGCHGGRHRSVFLAERLGRELGVLVEHRDIDK